MRSVMKAMFLPFLLLSLFATTKADADLGICANVNSAIQPCKPILRSRNLNDPSLDGCCAGLKNIEAISAKIGAKAACRCVYAALNTAANPTSVAIGGGLGGGIGGGIGGGGAGADFGFNFGAEYPATTSRSSEEEDELQRSTKKFKESNGAKPFTQPRPLVSYRDTLVGDIPGAYEQAFKFDKNWEVGYESDEDLEPLVKGMVEVKLYEETKARIKAPWSKALIVRTFREANSFADYLARLGFQCRKIL